MLTKQKTIKIPKSLPRFEYLMLNDSRKTLVLSIEQKLQSVIASGSCRYPPLEVMYGSIKAEQDDPLGGLKWRYSFSAQMTLVSLRPTPRIPSTKYVKGDTLYMKIQNRGRLPEDDKTPQKTRHNEKRRLATLPPFSAESIPAITMLVNVDVNIKNAQMNRNMRPPRSLTAFVGMAFR